MGRYRLALIIDSDEALSVDEIASRLQVRGVTVVHHNLEQVVDDRPVAEVVPDRGSPVTTDGDVERGKR
jgi:hypothetical protein